MTFQLSLGGFLRLLFRAFHHGTRCSRIEWEPLELCILAPDVGLKISQAQLCSSIRDCHATFLVKNTIFKGEVAWQPLKELQICSSSILDPPTRAFKWDIVCLSTIITFEEIRGYVKKCWFYIVKIDNSWHNLLFLQTSW